MRGWMENWRRYALTLLTVLLIVLGAAMPWLSALLQDARVGKLREDLELNTVSLTLLESSGVEQALRIASSECMEIPWGGGTNLTREEADQAALGALDELYRFGLLSDDSLDLLNGGEMSAEPFLAVAEDGSSALLWDCRLADAKGRMVPVYVTVDDVSGQMVRLAMTDPNPVEYYGEFNSASERKDGTAPLYVEMSVERYFILLERWTQFLQYYYNADAYIAAQLDGATEKEARFQLELDLYEGEDIPNCLLSLDLYVDEVLFNY